MDLLDIDLINWTNYFKGNYKKGVVRLRAILDEPFLYERFKVDLAAMNSIITCHDRNSAAMMKQIYDTGLGEDLIASYAIVAGYETVENLINAAHSVVCANIMNMSDSLAAAVAANETAITAISKNKVAAEAVLSSEVAIVAIAASEIAKPIFAESLAIFSEDASAIKKIMSNTYLVDIINSNATTVSSFATSSFLSSVVASEALSDDVSKTMIFSTDIAHYIVEFYAYDSLTSDSGGSGTGYYSINGGSETSFSVKGTGTTTTTKAIKQFAFNLTYRSSISGSYPSECQQLFRYQTFNV